MNKREEVLCEDSEENENLIGLQDEEKKEAGEEKKKEDKEEREE